MGRVRANQNINIVRDRIMTKREIASLAIKLMGVFILLKSIAYIPMAYSGVFYAFQGHGEDLLQTLFMIMMSTATAMIPLAFSVLIIIFSDKVAARLIKDDNAVEATGGSISKDEVMVIAVSCLGLYFIITAAPMLVRALLNNAAHMRQQIGIPFVNPSGIRNLFRNLIVPAVQVGLGIWLFAGSKGIVKLWKKIRS